MDRTDREAKTPKWNRWKLTHKETGLTFNQYYRKFPVKGSDGIVYDYRGIGEKLIPILLDSGMPAVYIDTTYYPGMFFLVNSEWDVVMKPTSGEKND